MDDDYKMGREAYIISRHSPATIARLFAARTEAKAEDLAFKRGYDDERRRQQDEFDEGDFECV